MHLETVSNAAHATDRKTARKHMRCSLRAMARAILMATVFLATAPGFAAELAVDSKLPPYQPGAAVTGTIVAAGNHATDALITAWASKFARFHPGVSIELRTDTRLTTDAFDVAIAGSQYDIIPSARELVPSEDERLTQKFGGAPRVVAVATGSYATKSGTHAIAFYVNAENPLQRLTLPQVREIYAPGGKITTWGQLGLTGEWANQRINVFSLPVSDPNGNPLGIINFLQKRIMGGSKQFRRSIYQVDSNGAGLDHHMLNRIVRQVAEDRYAIGFSGFAFAAEGTKTLELAETESGPYYAGTLQQVADRVYPLTRTIYFAINHPANKPLPAPLNEFLRFILSRDGQSALTEGAVKYLPLTAELAQRERERLDQN
jgi:phosphate transport system substrate-binding protein